MLLSFIERNADIKPICFTLKSVTTGNIKTIIKKDNENYLLYYYYYYFFCQYYFYFNYYCN